MKAFTIDASDDKFIISIDKKSISKDTLLRLLDDLRLEAIAESVNFDDEIEKLGEEIKGEWWAMNKDRFIPGDEK